MADGVRRERSFFGSILFVGNAYPRVATFPLRSWITLSLTGAIWGYFGTRLTGNRYVLVIIQKKRHVRTVVSAIPLASPDKPNFWHPIGGGVGRNLWQCVDWTVCRIIFARPRIKIWSPKMAIRGRKPKPTALKIINGNPGHRALNKNEVQVCSGVPECPEWIEGEAKKEWDRVTTIHSQSGIIAPIDGSQLAVYCQLYGEFVNAQREKLPFTANMISQMRALASCFGLEPSSRARLSGVAAGKQTNKWSKLDGKK